MERGDRIVYRLPLLFSDRTPFLFDRPAVCPARKDIMKHFILIQCLCLLFIAGCLPQTAMLKPRPAEEGALYVFLQPFPRETDALRFSLAEATAVREDGAEFPLTLTTAEMIPREMK